MTESDINQKFNDFVSQLDPKMKAIIQNVNELTLDQKKCLMDQFSMADLIPQKVSSWAESMVYNCQIISSGTANIINHQMFFVQLHGLLDEILGYMTKQSGNIPAMNLVGISIDSEFVKSLKLIVLKLGELKSKFSEDDLLTIEYLRHNFCHPFVNGYTAQFEKNSDQVHLLRSGKERKEIRSRVQNILNVEEKDFISLSVGYNSKIREESATMLSLIKKWSEAELGCY